MLRKTDLLTSVRVASPCPASWTQMEGTDQVRFCSQCHLSVYNLSGMTRAQAEALIREHEGRLCVRFHRRRDGTVLTRDCPVGLRAARRKLALAVVATMALVGSALGMSAPRATRAGTGYPGEPRSAGDLWIDLFQCLLPGTDSQGEVVGQMPVPPTAPPPTFNKP